MQIDLAHVTDASQGTLDFVPDSCFVPVCVVKFNTFLHPLTIGLKLLF